MGLDVSTQTSVLSQDASTQTAQPSPTLRRDASSQVAQRNVAFKDASTQLSFAEFFERSILSKALPPRPIPLLQPGDIDTVNSLSSTSSNSGPIPVPHTQHGRTPLPPPELEEQTLLRISHNIPSRAVPARLPSTHALCSSSLGTQSSSQLPPALQLHVSTTHVGPRPTLYTEAHPKPVLVPPFRNPPEARAGRGPFPKPNAYYHTHGTIRTAQTCWARSPPQCRQ